MANVLSKLPKLYWILTTNNTIGLFIASTLTDPTTIDPFHKMSLL